MANKMYLLILSLLFISCGGVNIGGNNQTTPSYQSNVQNREIPADASITLERGLCLRPCPKYKVTISADGRVVYEGRDNVKRKGKVEGSISREALQELLAGFEQIDYFELQGSYEGDLGCPQFWNDQPIVTTSLTLGGKSKTVKHNHGCRGSNVVEKLEALESKIDEVVGTERWI